jgi:hypothetical protein
LSHGDSFRESFESMGLVCANRGTERSAAGRYSGVRLAAPRPIPASRNDTPAARLEPTRPRHGLRIPGRAPERRNA